MTAETILLVHNRYREPGGEDQVFEQEAQLLRSHGHTVHQYVESNDDLDESRPLAAGLEAIWSRRVMAKLQSVVCDVRPDVVHFHNTFGRISPAAYYACKGLPVVQTLHNYRLGCLNACCTRDGRSCQACVSNFIPVEGLLNRCYRGSASASLAMASIGAVHKTLGTYRRKVDAFISTSHFAQSIHLRSGVPAERSFVKPNFTGDVAACGPKRRRAVLFAGRISNEKGIQVLLEAWKLASIDMELIVAGDGPELQAVREDRNDVQFLGRVPHARLLQLMQQCACLVQPSLLWENCSLVILEALASGLPVIASGHGSMTEVVADGKNGWLFTPGDAHALAQVLQKLASATGEQLHRMGQSARDAHAMQFSAAASYRKLAEIYARVCRS